MSVKQKRQKDFFFIGGKRNEIKRMMNWANQTFSKAILSHFVPVVQEFKEAVPSWAPAGTDCSAIQFTCEVPLEPSPYSKTQTVNALLFTDSTQIAAPFPPVELFVAWLLEMKILISCPPLKGSSKETFLQANRLKVVVTLHFPALKLTPVVQTRKTIKCHCAIIRHFFNHKDTVLIKK